MVLCSSVPVTLHAEVRWVVAMCTAVRVMLCACLRWAVLFSGHGSSGVGSISTGPSCFYHESGMYICLNYVMQVMRLMYDPFHLQLLTREFPVHRQF